VLAGLIACGESRDLGAPCDDCTARIHPPGILDPENPDFHPTLLAERGWDLGLCATCHGDEFSGGASGKSCLTCHADGPTACVTCHERGPQSGAHQAHAMTTTGCAQCHQVPMRWDDPGHILHDPPPAEVTFGALAELTPESEERAGPATFEADTCRNVYCHGDVLSAGGAMTRPRWQTPASTTCGTCHGAPPPDHAATDTCTTCHPSGLTTHVDGLTQIGQACSDCHGSAASPAPPVDLSGATSPTALGVGAHQAHLDVPSGLRGPIPCVTCHVVPATLDAPGHIDTSLPAEVEPGLGWDRDARTCASAWCHGPARPVWTTQVGDACGTCHGIPPASPPHDLGMTLSTCVTCHARSVVPGGAILVVDGASHHMNGTVDAD
jgi:predicted CxxxxCH...CXXCH cytochrome family protein